MPLCTKKHGDAKNQGKKESKFHIRLVTQKQESYFKKANQPLKKWLIAKIILNNDLN